mgnify:FL=1
MDFINKPVRLQSGTCEGKRQCSGGYTFSLSCWVRTDLRISQGATDNCDVRNRKYFRNDGVIKKLRSTAAGRSSPPGFHHDSGENIDDPSTKTVCEQYRGVNNVLVHQSHSTEDVRLAISESLVQKLTNYFYQLLGYFGATKVYNAMKREHYWSNMYAFI